MSFESILSRRAALQQLACGVGGLGLAALLADEARAAAPGPHHTPKAKSLIFLNMQGGPTQFETFDFKPEMAKYDGKEPPAVSGRQDGTVRFNPGSTITAPVFPYLRHPRSDVATTEVFPHMAKVLDELCVIRSMIVDSPSHPSALTQSMTGYTRVGMPSIGSWLLYGLGSANRNLPGFVYLAEGYGHGNGFLPADTQGMPVGAKVPNIKRAATTSEAQQRDLLDYLARLNADFAAQHPGESVLNARIEAAELAFRMQMSCPEAVDLTQESTRTLEMYGVTGGNRQTGRASRTLSQTPEDFSTMCLVARRLVERGVRMVTIGVGGRRGWDQHGNLKESIRHNATIVDQGMAALVQDLKVRGLLDSTIVMWGGEFGRTPYAQGKDGRDHFAKGFTYWLAGGGARKGIYHGETDDIGLTITKDPVHIHDLHATILHLMGLDHEKLTYRYAGRDHRLTDVHGKVVHGVIA